MSSRSRPLMMADWWMRTMLNDCKIAKCYILNDYKFILNNRIQFYLDFNWKDSYGICYYRIHPDDDYIQSIDFNYQITGNLFVLSNKDNNWPIRIFGDWLIDDFTDNSISLSMYDGKDKVQLNLSKTDMLPEL